MRLLAFVLALLLLAGTVDPTKGWLIALVVLTGVAVVRPRARRFFAIRPRLELAPIGALVLASLLLAGTIDATRDWLIALTAIAGVSAFMPGILGDFDDMFPFGNDHGSHSRAHRRHRRWQWDWDGDDWR